MSEWRLEEAFDTDGGRVRWRVLGEGPPVVLCHGTPFSSFVWRDIASALGSRHRVYVWDMLGYGQSDQRDDQDMSLAAQARILTQLLVHWQLAAPAVVGHDFGGAVALRALLVEGAAVDRLALADAVALAPWGTDFFRLAREHADVFTQLPRSHHEAMLRAHVATAAHQPVRAPVLDALVAPWLSPAGQRAYYRNMVQNTQRWTDEIQPRYGELDLPVLILWGEEDRWVPVEKAYELDALLPASRLRVLPDTGHLLQEDAPAVATAELLAFLQK